MTGYDQTQKKLVLDQARLIKRTNLTDNLAIFRFQPTNNSPILDFKPGQFVNLGLQLDEKSPTYRTYSISSSPYEKRYYEFYIKHKERPTLGKFTTALFKMNVNETIFLQKPRGVFTIEETKPDGTPDTRQLILVASGTGLAPFVSYILYLKQTMNAKKIVLIHGASYPEELGYKELFENLVSQNNGLCNFTYIPTISRPNDSLSKNWKGNTGRVDSLLSGIGSHNSQIEKILGIEISPQNSFFYLCGHDKMIDDVSEMLLPLDFVDIRHKHKDGSFDFKYEYGF